MHANRKTSIADNSKAELAEVIDLRSVIIGKAKMSLKTRAPSGWVTGNDEADREARATLMRMLDIKRMQLTPTQQATAEDALKHRNKFKG